MDKIVVNTVKVGSAFSTVTFGAVSVNAPSPKAVEMRHNVAFGQEALARAAPKIAKAGVTVKSAATVPLFRADPQDPSRLIREVNGKTATGRFVNGKFKVLSAA
ncbi:hypothetical protein [Hydrogenophaga sp.]|uniref:hypothetical protein n=1 Tax=Hydrogenophaga sp. TaxID=1904254 RepID=UPI00271FB119|nr:hypothetical protein [Hydrogenophaga sp.]MDO9436319.1 hypothetical protein [Hydrogenophaga sp.]